MPIVIGISIFIAVVVLGTSGVLQEKSITKSDVATVVEEEAERVEGRDGRDDEQQTDQQPRAIARISLPPAEAQHLSIRAEVEVEDHAAARPHESVSGVIAVGPQSGVRLGVPAGGGGRSRGNRDGESACAPGQRARCTSRCPLARSGRRMLRSERRERSRPDPSSVRPPIRG